MERKVCFYSGPGLKLAGILAAPDVPGGAKRRPAIVLCHAGSGTKESFLPEVSQCLVSRGFAVLRFDYRGFGESEGDPCRLIPWEQVDDIRSAISFMQLQDEVDRDRIGLWGPSSGGANVSYTSGIDRRVKCMVSLSGMGDMGRWLKNLRRYWEWKEFLQRLENDRAVRVLTGVSQRVITSEIVLPVSSSGMETLPDPKNPAVQQNELTLESAEAMIQFRPEAVAGGISPRAAMWICTPGDTVVPPEESQSMFEKAHQPKRFVAIEGFKHYELYHGTGFDLVMDNTVQWFSRYL